MFMLLFVTFRPSSGSSERGFLFALPFLPLPTPLLRGRFPLPRPDPDASYLNFDDVEVEKRGVSDCALLSS
jgi:hypothetical protein